MSASFRSVVRALTSRLALAAVALGIAIAVAGPASAEVRRQPLREIDILLSLIDADVPSELWPALDEPIRGYRSRVVELERTWADEPSLDRLIERPAELQTRRRDQERRSQALANEQRRLIDELRAALLREHGRAEFDLSRVDALQRWLDARVAARTFARFDRFVLGPKHLPQPSLLDVDPEDRRATARAMEPGLVDVAKKGDALLAAALLSAPGKRPTDGDERVLPGFEEDSAGNRDARHAAADEFLAASTAVRRMALKAAPSRARVTLERSLTTQLEPYAGMARRSALMRRVAPLVRDLDDGQRERLRQAARTVEAFLDDHRKQTIDGASSHDAGFTGHRNPNSGVFVGSFPGLERTWRQTVTEVLGDRSERFFRALGHHGADPGEELIKLFGTEVAAEIRADRDAEWQLRQIAVPVPMMGARWRSLADVGPVSEALRAELVALVDEADRAPSSTPPSPPSPPSPSTPATRANGATPATAAASARAAVMTIESALAAHDAAWRSEIEPLQARARANFDEVPTGADDRVDTSTITADLAALRHAIERVEADFARAIAPAVGDPLGLARWRLDRAMELLAPEQSAERRLWGPMLPYPPRVDEVLKRAGYGRATDAEPSGVAGRTAPADGDDQKAEVAALAMAIAYGIAMEGNDAGDRLVPALWERQGQLERLLVVMVIRESLLRHPGRMTQELEHFQEKLTSLLRAFKIDAGAADLAVIHAWEAILADWAVALPDHAPALRRAWLLELFPELHLEWVQTAGVVRRLGETLVDDDPRRAWIEALAEAHSEERAELIAAAAEALAPIPRDTEWVSLSVWTKPSPRELLATAYRTADRDLSARTLRRAIALLGSDVALAAPVTPAALERLEQETGFAF